MAAIWFTADETAIKQLLHVSEVNYDAITLSIFVVSFFFLSPPFLLLLFLLFNHRVTKLLKIQEYKR